MYAYLMATPAAKQCMRSHVRQVKISGNLGWILNLHSCWLISANGPCRRALRRGSFGEGAGWRACGSFLESEPCRLFGTTIRLCLDLVVGVGCAGFICSYHRLSLSEHTSQTIAKEAFRVREQSIARDERPYWALGHTHYFSLGPMCERRECSMLAVPQGLVRLSRCWTGFAARLQWSRKIARLKPSTFS